MMRWLKSNLCLLRLTGRSPSRLSKDRMSIDRRVESGYEGNGHAANGVSAEAISGPQSTTDSEADDLDDDTEWLRSNPSMSAAKGVRRATGGDGADGEDGITEGEGDEETGDQVVNVLVSGSHGASLGGTGSDQSISRKSLSSLHSVKSILIGEKNSKNITKKNSGHYPDVDSEKFVRFGA
jgi:hypothetical protein